LRGLPVVFKVRVHRQEDGMAKTGAGSAAGGLRRTDRSYAAIITLGGARFVFDSAAGEDLGAYAGDFVRQGCIRVMRKDTPLTVYFRPDIGLARLEVVVELGRIWLEGTGFAAAHITTPYTCEIRHNGRAVAMVRVPYHWWFSRWRWQSAPRPIVRSRAQLLEKRLAVPYGRSGLYGGGRGPREVEWSGPMDTAGIDTYMPATGDRADIGLLTEHQAAYFITGSSAALASLLAQGEACGTMPIHWRDERTGALVDVYEHPRIGADKEGRPRIGLAPRPRLSGPGSRFDPRYIVYDTAHAPAASYLPFVLTDDPFFLEELEAQGSFAILQHAWFRNLYHLPGLALPGQPRAFAWGMRSLFQLGVVAPEKPPRWLMGRHYWRRCIADNLAFARLYMKSPARVHRIFRAFPQSNPVYPWQGSYLAVALGAGVWMGQEDWRDFYRWYYASVTPLCNGRSGWNREWPTPYYFRVMRLPNTHKVMLVQDTALDNETAASWGEAWAWYKNDYNIDDNGWDGHSLMHKQGPAYILSLRGSLALATHLDVPEAKQCYDYIAGQLPAWMARFGHHGDYRWSINPA
jgi:hypothetical protein